MSASRPLPPRPSLEFEHKEAKALLRLLRAGDPAALARARERHSAVDPSDPARIRLADAQLVIAREYGFTSWPRLVHYFGDVERQRYSNRTIQSAAPDFYEGSVQSLIAQHRNRRAWAARAIASYVPRFYGMSANDVFDASITEADARLAVARSNGCTSWESMLERVASETARRRDRDSGWEVDPMRYAGNAIEAADLPALQRVIDEHPELIRPSDYESSKGYNLLAIYFHHERKHGREPLQPILEWLESMGLDAQLELNRQLCGHRNITTDKVRWLLDRGADPNWIAPNGIPVLEHALLRCTNGEVVDLIAARTVPREALWIAAGLGDVDGVRGSLDRDGKPTVAARRIRPDFDAVGAAIMPSHPDPDDEHVLMEAFFIATQLGRIPVMEYMMSRGFSPDSLVWDMPVINVAVGNAMEAAVECLIRCGASLDLRGHQPDSTARELARQMVEMRPNDAKHRRIAELCGLDPDAILAELNARPVEPPRIAPDLQEALELAGDDAFRLGQPDIREENLLFGLLRGGKLAFMYFTRVSRMDLDRFRDDVKHRALPADDRVERPKLPIHPDAQALLQASIAEATQHRRNRVTGQHLLWALTRDDQGVAAQLLARYGGNVEDLNVAMEKGM